MASSIATSFQENSTRARARIGLDQLSPTPGCRAVGAQRPIAGEAGTRGGDCVWHVPLAGAVVMANQARPGADSGERATLGVLRCGEDDGPGLQIPCRARGGFRIDRI